MYFVIVVIPVFTFILPLVVFFSAVEVNDNITLRVFLQLFYVKCTEHVNR